MKKIMILTVALTAALLLLLGTALAQKASPVGTWSGYTILGDGSKATFNLSLEKSPDGYAGKITDDSGIIPEMALKNIVFKDATLTFELDLPQGTETTLIKIELKLDGDTLKGNWEDPNGETNIIELERKK